MVGSNRLAVTTRVALVVLAGCGSRTATPIPHGRPGVQLVRCTPATPPPQATDAVEKETRGTARASFSVGGRITVGKKPSLTFGTPSVTGPITPDEVSAAARGKQADVLACFGAEAKALSRVAVVYRLGVGSDGAVVSVDSSAGTFSGPLDACVRRSLRMLKLPSKGSPSTFGLPLVYDSTGTFAVPESSDGPALEPDPWTPFALVDSATKASAVGAARATEAALRTRVAAIDKCFANPASTGSLRILLELDISGELTTVRAGGIGDKDGETCAAKSLSGLHVMTPAQEHVEISCDLSRGDAAPWRVSPAAGYQVIEVDARGLKHGTEVVVPGVSEPEPLPADIYVVVARPDTLGGMLQLALMWARDSSAVVLAVGDGKAAPVFLGMGNAAPSEEGDAEALRPAIRVGKQYATGCIGRATHKASVTSSVELGGLMQKLAARCRTLHCAPTMVVAIDTDAVAKDLLEVAGAARRNGFDRVLFGGSELGCTAEPKKKGTDSDIAPDFE